LYFILTKNEWSVIMFVVDTHCDSISREIKEGSGLVSSYNASRSARVQVYAMFCDFPWPMPEIYKQIGAKDGRDIVTGGDLLDYYIDKYYERIERYSNMTHANSFAEIKDAICVGHSAGLLSVEGCNAIDTLEKLNTYYKKGVRLVGLTWNHNNVVACGASVSRTDDDKGLSDYGREFIKECDRLGIVVDVSHSSDKTIDDVLSVSDRAVIASHSNFRKVCDVNRNLEKCHSDEIVRRGGFIGLNLCDAFVTHNKDVPYVSEMLLPHVQYALDNGYGDNLGFGFDIDGIDVYPSDISMEDSIHDKYIELLSKHYDNDITEKIAGVNFMNFYREYDKK
jgi:membrane dipeptidase